MDPNATWQQLLDALEASDWDTAGEFAEELLTWLLKGGFPPVVFPERRLGDEWSRALARLTCELVLAEPRWAPTRLFDNP